MIHSKKQGNLWFWLPAFGSEDFKGSFAAKWGFPIPPQLLTHEDSGGIWEGGEVKEGGLLASLQTTPDGRIRTIAHNPTQLDNIKTIQLELTERE